MSDKNFPDVIRKIHDQDNRFGIEGMCNDITELQWKINTEGVK